MPATEETYRPQPTLHVVFALTSIAMTLSIVWMIMADHLRPWKEVQREFQQVERTKLEATEAEKLTEQKAKYLAPEGLNVYDVLDHETLIMSRATLDAVTARLKTAPRSEEGAA